MKQLAIVNTVNRAVHKAGFQIKKYSPEILIVAGVVGTVTSAVLACRATTKLDGILSEGKDKVEQVHAAIEAGEVNGYEYTEEDGRKDLTTIYAKTAVKVVKLYAPAVALGALSISGMIASNQILRKRNVALAAAYATVDKTFKEYRERAVNRFGKEVDRQLRYNIKSEKIEETVTDPETGKTKKIKKTVEVANLDGRSEYARFFDDGCKGWEKDAEHNLCFLRAQQQYANDRLVVNGYLFLNDVYDMLGIPRTKAGQVVGWIYDPEHGSGDNYVDFGIYDISKPKNRDFVNGYERVILLDFNVDGPILNNLP